jgi:hypothetical protein
MKSQGRSKAVVYPEGTAMRGSTWQLSKGLFEDMFGEGCTEHAVQLK